MALTAFEQKNDTRNVIATISKKFDKTKSSNPKAVGILREFPSNMLHLKQEVTVTKKLRTSSNISLSPEEGKTRK